jgi:hypothetical protein
VADRRGLFMGALIVAGLMAFEAFNFGTTEFALGDLLGGLHLAGVRWATVLALAFCAIDFAGLARLFTPPGGRQEAAEVWYLLGAWLLAATMNATLTWWGVSLALIGHESIGSSLLGADALRTAAPVFVALLVWLLRVLIIGTLSVSGERLFSYDESRPRPRLRLHGNNARPAPVVGTRPAGPANGASPAGFRSPPAESQPASAPAAPRFAGR